MIFLAFGVILSQTFLKFIEILNGHHASIKVKQNLQSEKTEFLDTEAFIVRETNGWGNLGTRVYCKAEDTHALLYKSSFHPRLTFRGIVKSQLIRYHRICSEAKDVETATRTLFKALRNRGYSRSFLGGMKVEVKLLFDQGFQPRQTEKNNTLVPFISKI